MKCPNCGAESIGKYCDYCGSELPKNSPDTINYGNHTTIINNYYQNPETQSQNEVPVHITSEEALSQKQTPVYMHSNQAQTKSKYIALLLCIFLGYFGAHQFYVGKTGMGILYLFTMGLFGIGWIVDIIKILTGSFRDSNNIALK